MRRFWRRGIATGIQTSRGGLEKTLTGDQLSSDRAARTSERNAAEAATGVRQEKSSRPGTSRMTRTTANGRPRHKGAHQRDSMSTASAPWAAAFARAASPLSTLELQTMGPRWTDRPPKA